MPGALLHRRHSVCGGAAVLKHPVRGRGPTAGADRVCAQCTSCEGTPFAPCTRLRDAVCTPSSVRLAVDLTQCLDPAGCGDAAAFSSSAATQAFADALEAALGQLDVATMLAAGQLRVLVATSPEGALITATIEGMPEVIGEVQQALADGSLDSVTYTDPETGTTEQYPTCPGAQCPSSSSGGGGSGAAAAAAGAVVAVLALAAAVLLVRRQRKAPPPPRRPVPRGPREPRDGYLQRRR